MAGVKILCDTVSSNEKVGHDVSDFYNRRRIHQSHEYQTFPCNQRASRQDDHEVKVDVITSWRVPSAIDLHRLVSASQLLLLFEFGPHFLVG
jgi:hypothetical protein